MNRASRSPQPVHLDWVLVANAARARLFARDPDNNAMKELRSFVHPASRLKGSSLGADRGGQVRKSAVSTEFAPRIDVHQKEHASFAHELGAHLEDAARAHCYPRLDLIASKEFLGELRARLGSSTQRLLGVSVGLDLTLCEGAELERRVAESLHRRSERVT
ncbi:MAG TPA: host attachment protein [Rubrivivax sp.]|nr:host attachment protein [Rubrivivax sp.]